MNRLAPYAKAVVAFIAPGVVALVQAVSDASPAGGSVTGPEWVNIGAACVLTAAAVYAVPNRTRQRVPAGIKATPGSTMGGIWGGGEKTDANPTDA